MTGWIIAAAGYHLMSRLAYVVGVGVVLSRRTGVQAHAPRQGDEEAYRRFRRWAAVVMNNDAVSFVLLALLSWGTLHVAPAWRAVMVAGGLLLIVIGIGVKWWAAARLGHDAYYWHNCFVPEDTGPLTPPGPYRYLDNPMYTVGYLHAWGFALVLGSWPALVAAAFDQAAILTFHHLVEKPHYRALTAGRR